MKMPKWRKSPEKLIEFFTVLMKSFPEVSERKVFGYPCGFVNGNMAVGLHADSLFIRMSGEDGAELLGIRGASTFEPVPGRVMRGYVVVPQAMHHNPTEVKHWIRKGIDYTSTLPPKQSR